MKVLLVDDESLALKLLNKILCDFNFVEVVGMYTDIVDAIEFARNNEIDAVFLDIEMPEISGIDAASIFQTIHANIEIVFVTAYSDFAIESYELNAIDYILKPISKTRIEKTLDRINSKLSLTLNSAKKYNHIKCIKCFGIIDIIFEDPTRNNIKWRTSKTKELFYFLVHNKNSSVTRNKIQETMWPYMDKEKSAPLLSTTIYNLRKLLKDLEIEDVFEFSHQGCKFLTKLQCDFTEFETTIKSIPTVNNYTIRTLENAIKLYTGDYFEDNDFIWSIFEKQRYIELYIHTLKQMSKYYVDIKDYPNAIIHLRKILLKNPLLEEINQLLMEVYYFTGDFKAVERQYNEFSYKLMEELGLKPSLKTKNLLYKLCSNN